MRPSAAPTLPWRPEEATNAAPTRAPEAALPKRPGAETLFGALEYLSASTSPTARTVRRRDTLVEASGANGVFVIPSILPREAAQLNWAGALIDRIPATAPRPRARATRGPTA